MEFPIRPWDRPRPRLATPRAEFSLEHAGRTYFGRARHGLTFLLEAGKSADWMLAFEPGAADFAGELARGRVARYVLLPFEAETWRREFPLFLRPDGTGWMRESWNREDIAFNHDLSLHEWLEAPAHSLFPFAAGLFTREIAPKLEALGWPKGRDLALEFGGGTRAGLLKIVGNALALEEAVRGSGRIIRATFQSESPFFRAGCFAVQAERGEADLYFDEASGERFRLPWKRPTLRLSRRFWLLCDWAIDAIAPLGHYFDTTDKGAGRLSEAPQPRVFSLQFLADKLPPPDDAHAWLAGWLDRIGGDTRALEENFIADFEARSRE